MVSLEHVSKRYGKTVALSDVSFDIAPGETAGLLGRNGAGKTTALNLITGYFPPDSGTVRIGGRDMLTDSRECKRRIGYLPERPPLYDEMSVKDYLTFVSELREVAPRARKAHIAEILALCDLEEAENRIIGHLSRGYRQRVGIAQALCGNPDVLIFDEPTVGLDPVQVVEIRSLIRRLSADHTVLFSSHILSEVQQLCSKALILHEGKLIRAFDLNRQEELLHLDVIAVGREGEMLPALRSLHCVRNIEKRPSAEEGTVHLRISCRPGDDRGRAEDQLFHLFAALDAPLRQMMPEKNDLEATFLQAIQE